VVPHRVEVLGYSGEEVAFEVGAGLVWGCGFIFSGGVVVGVGVGVGVGVPYFAGETVYRAAGGEGDGCVVVVAKGLVAEADS